MSRLNPGVYAKAKVAAEAVKKELEPQILGRKRAAHSCACGGTSIGSSTAIEVMPGYEDQIGLWYMWTVKMREDDNSKPAYSIGISAFVDSSVLKGMFQRHFAGIDVSV